MSKGHVLSEEELREWEELISEMPTCIDFASATECADLIATIRDRDKTIAEKDKRISFHSDLNDALSEQVLEYKEEIERLRQERDEYKRFVEQSKAGVFTYEESRERAKEVLTRTRHGRGGTK